MLQDQVSKAPMLLIIAPKLLLPKKKVPLRSLFMIEMAVIIFSNILGIWSNICHFCHGYYLVTYSHHSGESLGDLLHHQSQAPQDHFDQDDVCGGVHLDSSHHHQPVSPVMMEQIYLRGLPLLQHGGLPQHLLA